MGGDGVDLWDKVGRMTFALSLLLKIGLRNLSPDSMTIDAEQADTILLGWRMTEQVRPAYDKETAAEASIAGPVGHERWAFVSLNLRPQDR